jgi:hypothetical protein
MNNFEEVQLLIDSWIEIIKTCARDSIKNASKMKNGLDSRIFSNDGKKIIFDYVSEKRQKEIQNKLYYLRPDLTELISSEPPILDEEWNVKDYIELYHNHYMLVVEKLRKIINAELRGMSL